MSNLNHQLKVINKSGKYDKNLYIPGILYGYNIKDNIQLLINKEEIKKFLLSNKKKFLSFLINLDLNDNIYKVIIKEVQWNKITMEPIHLDFFSVKDNKLKIKTEIVFNNVLQNVGVKKGGKIKIITKWIMVECDCNNIPPQLEVDVLNMDIGTKIHSNYLNTLYPDIKILTSVPLLQVKR